MQKVRNLQWLTLYSVPQSELSPLPSLDNPVYYNKAIKLLKVAGIQPKQVVTDN